MKLQLLKSNCKRVLTALLFALPVMLALAFLSIGSLAERTAAATDCFKFSSSPNLSSHNIGGSIKTSVDNLFGSAFFSSGLGFFNFGIVFVCVGVCLLGCAAPFYLFACTRLGAIEILPSVMEELHAKTVFRKKALVRLRI